MLTVAGTRYDPVTAVEDLEPEIRVYPLPFGEKVNLDLTLAADQQITMMITSMLGVNVQRQIIQGLKGLNTFEIQTDQLSQGLYIMQVNAGNNAYSLKVVKK